MPRTTPLVAFAAVLLAASPAAAREPGPIGAIQRNAADPLPDGVKARGGAIEQVWSWTGPDGVRTGLAVFSSRETSTGQHVTFRKLYVQLYEGAPGALKQVRLVQDGVSACNVDVTAAFVPGSVTITVEDGDGKVELTFAYDISCRGDVSPDTRKLLVLEDTAKHALRGTTRVDVGDGQTLGGDYTLDGFAKQPELRSYAIARWAALLGK